jgi:hypothetical protein
VRGCRRPVDPERTFTSRSDILIETTKALWPTIPTRAPVARRLGYHESGAHQRGSAGSWPGGHAMKMNGTGVRIGVTVLALGVSLLAMPTLPEAQRAAGISRVGWLEVCGPGPRRPHFDIFRARLAEQGYVEGKNLIIEQRFADCRYDRMPGLAADLVQVPVDVLFTMGTRAARIVAGTVKTTTRAVSCPTGPPNPRFIPARLSRSQKFWMALGRVTCRCDRLRGSSWSSTTGRRRRSDSQSHRRCCCEPTR